MKKLKLFLMLFIAAVSVCNFVSCDKDDDKGGSAIVGTWVWQEDDDLFDSYTFSANGSYTNSWQEGSYTGFERGTYTFEKSILTMKSSDGWVDVYTAKISGNKLTLTDEDGDKWVYTRK
ncbi:MAG: lipocalin family protein [Alistipes sp.]|nr:lipocalin family protein [Alistipes sp.]